MTPFAEKLLNWYAQHGRKDLPWQAARDPYRIWVSEIMLQQTQVATVIDYFNRFITRFPDIAALAQAPLDEVMHYWTGLGYYARARNLHKAAQAIMHAHGGEFPREFDAVAALPGIGPSTAGAVLAFAFAQPHSILDGNVKRVLARYHRVAGWPGQRAVAERLWAHARAHTPAAQVQSYTQAIMDLGATVCRRVPRCGECPVADGCAAYTHGETSHFPTPAPRKTLPVKATVMLMIRDDDGAVLLERRPPAGIWGGLWGFPECADLNTARAYGAHRGWQIECGEPWPSLRHTFTHFHLDIVPLPAQLRTPGTSHVIMEPAANVWYRPHAPDARGLPAPVKQLLQRLRNDDGPHGALRKT